MHQGNKETVCQVKMEKNTSTFSLRKELEKVNISIPLTELLKQPSYKRKIYDFMEMSHVISTQDNLNLQEERPMVMFDPHVEKQDRCILVFVASDVI